MSNRAHQEGAPDRNLRTLADSYAADSDWESGAFDAKDFVMGAIQAIWSGLDGILGALIIEGSVNGINWCALGSIATDVILDVPAGNQIWEIKEVTCPFYRLRYEANGNTTGTITIKARGRGFV